MNNLITYGVDKARSIRSIEAPTRVIVSSVAPVIIAIPSGDNGHGIESMVSWILLAKNKMKSQNK